MGEISISFLYIRNVKFDSSKLWGEELSAKEFTESLKNEIFSRISNEQILNYYIPGQGNKYKTLCVFHKESTPSLSVDLTKGIFKCFGCGKGGDGIKFVQEKYNLSYFEALRLISSDFGITGPNPHKIPSEVLGLVKKPKIVNNTIIRIKDRPWEQKDVIYWEQFGVDINLAKFYNVYPITHYWVDSYVFAIKPSEIAYAFLEKDKFQIYQPFADKDKKWFSNTGSMVYGYDQLPEYGELLFITSSKKDIMTLKSLGYNAVSPNNEGSKLPEQEYEDLNNRFDKIIIFFNNDDQGLKAAHYMGIDLGLDFIYIPREYDEKDPSDFHKIHGKDKTDKLIKELLNG